MRINNLFNDGKSIYVFYRDDTYNMKITSYTGFFPYFYEPDKNGQFISYKGDKLRKVIISNPSELAKKRSPNAYEADILFVKRFMIDKIDVIDPSPIKYCFVDIEVLTSDLPNIREAKEPISCISVYNSLSKNIQTFYLPEYESEYKMIDAFINYMKKEKFDIWFSWNIQFDYNYLHNRFPDFAEKISPIGKSRYGYQDKKTGDEGKYPAGMSIVDYLMWFKKITLGREKMYTLDYIAQKFLKVPPKIKVDFNKLSPELKKHNIDDVKLLIGLEEQMQLVKYYDEIRRITQVEWEDFEYNSRAIDMLLLKEAKQRNLALPMRPSGEGEEEVFEGAFREIYETGRLENIGKADVSSAYPYAIIEFCLDPANIVQTETEGVIRVGDDYFKQNPNALIPTIIKKLLVLKSTIKKELEASSIDDPNHKNIKIKYDAIKSLCNTAYGVTALKFFRLFDVRVASATTFVVRSLLHYIKDKLDASGHKVVYIDTDGVFYQNPSEEINKKLNEWVQQWVKETFKKESVAITFDFEGIYESILLLAKCRYVGRLRKTNGELEVETKGIEAKRKDSTKFMGKFQKILIDKILDNEPKEKIYDWIKTEIANFKTQNIIDISFPCKMAKQKIEYKSVPIFSRALDNTPEFKSKVGDSFYYIKMLGKDETKKEMVKAFNEERYDHINREDVDWQAMLERNIIMKLDVIFTAMKWNLTDIYIAPPTHKICSVCLKEKTICRFPETGNVCKVCQKESLKPPKRPKVVKDPVLPSKSSISDPLPSDKSDKIGQDTPDLTGNTPILTQSTDNKGVKVDKIDDKDLVTGTPVKTLKKRGRPKKLPTPENLNFGKSENEKK